MKIENCFVMFYKKKLNKNHTKQRPLKENWQDLEIVIIGNIEIIQQFQELPKKGRFKQGTYIKVSKYMFLLFF